MNDIQTASWRHTCTSFSEDENEAHSFSNWNWLRLNPPATAWHNADDAASGTRHVMNERGSYRTASTWKESSFSPRSRPFITVETLLEQVLFPPPASAAAKPLSPDWQQETVERDGKPCLRWSRDYVQHNFHVVRTIWTEPETQRIVRSENRQTNLLTGQPARLDVEDQFAYNVNLPEGIFEMPPDKPIVTRDFDKLWPDVWKTLSEDERAQIQETINQSDEGWREADFRTFASVRDFGYLPRLPDKSEWQARMKRYADEWTQWTTTVESVREEKYIGVTTSAYGFSGFPLKRRKVLGVRVALSVSWGEAGGWKGNAEFYLRRKGRGFRIVHWECPWEEIKAARARQEADIAARQ